MINSNISAKLRVVLSLGILWTFSSIHAQTVWTAEKCIEQALKTHLPLQSAQLQVRQVKLNQLEQRANRLPEVGVATRWGVQLGRTVDPTTNAFANQAIQYNLWQVNATMPIYQGQRNKYLTQQNAYFLAAAQADVAATKLEVKAQTMRRYLEVLLAKEKLAMAERNLQSSDREIEQMRELVQAGLQPANKLTSLAAQRARHQQAMVQAEAQVQTAQISLFDYLGMPLNQQVTFSPLNDLETTNRVVTNLSVEHFPTVQAERERRQAANYTTDILNSERLPSVSLNVGLNSNFSSAALQVAQNRSVPFEQTLWINGEESTVQGIQQMPDYEKNPYFNQLGENFGQVAELTVSYPIYDGGRLNRRLERAQLEQLQQQIQLKSVQQTARRVIEQLRTEYATAQSYYAATESSLQAAKEAYQQTAESVRLGAATDFDLQMVQLQVENAEQEWLQAKYQFQFQRILQRIYTE